MEILQVRGLPVSIRRDPAPLPLDAQGFTLGESNARSKYGVTVVGVKSPGEDFTYARPETKVTSRDLLIVSGHVDLIERFAARP